MAAHEPTGNPAFDKAIADSQKLHEKPTDPHLLELYALYKQGMQKPPFKDAKKPGYFDVFNKAKYGAWAKLQDPEVSQKEAQKRYVNLVAAFKKEYGFGG